MAGEVERLTMNVDMETVMQSLRNHSTHEQAHYDKALLPPVAESTMEN
jgi:hypothetical protein